jgi:hypothetical protein
LFILRKEGKIITITVERDTARMSVRRGHPPTGYITAAQAKKKLGDISDGKFRGYIQEGKIERLIPKGMKQGFYRREDVDRLAREIEAIWDSGKRGPQTQFQIATPEDIPTIAAIDEATFNAGKEDAEPKEAYLRWIEGTYLCWMTKNPKAFFVLRNASNKVVAFACLLPIKRDTLNRFVNGTIKMSDIRSEDVELFEPGKPLHTYVIALCVDPTYKGKIKEWYGGRMLSGLRVFLMELARNGIEIETITARNEKDKPDGRNLLNKLGIPQLRSPVPDMYLFSVRVADAGHPMLANYYDSLIEWKQQHSIKE